MAIPVPLHCLRNTPTGICQWWHAPLVFPSKRHRPLCFVSTYGPSGFLVEMAQLKGRLEGQQHTWVGRSSRLLWPSALLPELMYLISGLQ